ncbi:MULTISPECIES: golvesin C-terminal-like domain-containing protein [unclassified Marinobacter]|uniref:golvesin C-terminal-like domain-containing protein n=1 Tax=unclassified Marinobacter TaxID=83889 RepID=UPI003008B628
MSSFRIILALSIAGSLVGCAFQPEIDPNEQEAPASGTAGEYIVDNNDVAHFQVGNWKNSSHSGQFYGDDYAFAPSGTGESEATWNLNIIKNFNVYARWTSHSNRGTNVKYTVHHLDDKNNLVQDVVSVDQTVNGGVWFKLGTYRMSALTGRVTVSDDANGYVIADAILFEEVSVANPDKDADGIDDAWELQYGLNPNDGGDANNDLDGDGLTNLDEFVLLTDPSSKDSDADGVDDAFEVGYGLDPLRDDRSEDADADGYSNYEEFLASSDPNNADSLPASNIAFLNWTIPTERENGQDLSISEIAGYEIVYKRSVGAEQTTIDNGDPGFSRAGIGFAESTSVSGYIGENYLAVASGGGESRAEWVFSDLQPGLTYAVVTNWTSASNRASNAAYKLRYVDEAGNIVEKMVEVDQRSNGGDWQPLGAVIPGDKELSVSVTNQANGYVIVDAMRVSPDIPEPKVISVTDPTTTTYMIEDLSTGSWSFQIRVVDTDNVKSDLSDTKVKIVE